MGDRFKDQFDQIDDVLDDFQRRIDDLELRREANVRDIFEIDDRVIRLDAATNQALSRVPDIATNILQAILIQILEGGLTIGRWILSEDSSGDFRITDKVRNGYFRFPRTNQNR